MRVEQKRKRFKIIFIAFGLIILAIILTFVGVELVKRATVNDFDVKTDSLTCTDKDQIIKYLGSLQLNYFRFKNGEFSDDLRKKFFCIGEIGAGVSYPNKLVLEVKGRQAAFVLTSLTHSSDTNPVIELPDTPRSASESTKEAIPIKVLDQILKDIEQASGSGIFLTDKEGMVFEEITTDNVNFPRLSILGEKLSVGKKIPDRVIEKTDLLSNKLREIGVPIDNIIIIGDKLIINSKPRIIFSLKKRLDYQTASLQLILTQAKMNSDPARLDSNSIESIDLRFDKPVVVYSKVKS